MSLYYCPRQLPTTRVGPTEATTHRLPIFAPLPALHNQVDDKGKFSSPVSCPQNAILTPLILQEHLSGVFYPINHKPTISLVTPRFQTIPGGYILTPPRSNVNGVFAAGDVQYIYGTAKRRGVATKYNGGGNLLTSFTASRCKNRTKSFSGFLCHQSPIHYLVRQVPSPNPPRRLYINRTRQASVNGMFDVGDVKDRRYGPMVYGRLRDQWRKGS